MVDSHPWFFTHPCWREGKPTLGFTPSSNQASSINGFLKEAGREMAIAYGGGNIPKPQYFFFGEKIAFGHNPVTAVPNECLGCLFLLCARFCMVDDREKAGLGN